MMFQTNPEALPFFAAAVISSALALFAWRRRSTPMAIAFACMMMGEAAWAFFEALELVTSDLDTKILWFTLRATGSVTMLLSLLVTVLIFMGRGRWVKSPRFIVACSPALILLAAAWTNPWHHLYWTRIWNAWINQHWIAMPVYGPLWKAHFVCCHLIAATSTVLLAAAACRSTGVYRAQAAVMLFGAILPWAINVVDMSQIFGFIYVDSAAMTFGVTGLAFVPAIVRLQLLDLTPVAWAVVVEGIDDPVVVMDGRHRIVELNPAARNLIGVQGANVIGASAAHVFADWPRLREYLDRIASRDMASFEVEGSRSDPESSFDGRISQLGKGDQPAGWVLVLRETTHQKRATLERALMLREQTARAQAEAADIAKNKFLATLSHELRTPLTPILATVTAMLDDPNTPRSALTVFEMIRRNVMLETRLIDDLLDLSRIRRGSLLIQNERVNMHELVQNVIGICGDDLRNREFQVEVELLAHEYHVDADPTRVQQVLWNLVINAIKFTPNGGRLEVRSRNGADWSKSNGPAELLIEICDTGIGIDLEILPNLFDAAERGMTSASRRFGGLGLGLTICRSILQQQGGRLNAFSSGPGLGSTFTIAMSTVPPPRGADRPPDAREVEGKAPAPTGLKILLVEDNIDTRHYLSKLLASRGHRVQTAADLSSALEVALHADLDIIVSDIELPDGTGLELLQTVRATRLIPAVSISGFGSPDDIKASRSAGFAVHLTKPLEFRRLEQAIFSVAGRPSTQCDRLYAQSEH